MSVGSSPGGPRRAVLLLLLLTTPGILFSRGTHETGVPRPIHWDTPEVGFRTASGILDAGSGAPRDALRLEVDGVARGTGVEDGYGPRRRSEAHVRLRMKERDGRPTSGDRWVFLPPPSVAIEDSGGIEGHVSEGAVFFFQHVNEGGHFLVRLYGLPEGEVLLRRIVLEVPVIPVERQGHLRWSVKRGEELGVTFLDQVLFVNSDEKGAAWGAHSRGRFNPPTTTGTCIQGLLEDYEVRDAAGRKPETFIEGRSWGLTHEWWSGLGEELEFPLRVEARWRCCGPTTTCRFVIEDVRIPAPPEMPK